MNTKYLGFVFHENENLQTNSCQRGLFYFFSSAKQAICLLKEQLQKAQSYESTEQEAHAKL